MSRLRSLKVVAVTALALVVLVTGEMSQAIAEGFLIAEEQEMTSLLNRHRDEHALPPLRQDAALQMVARRQASRMVAAGYIYHNPDLVKEAEQAVPQWLRVGENVGVGSHVGEVHDAFLDSPLHHANVHHPGYDIVGLGAVPGAGAIYFTQNFALTGGGSTPAPSGAGGGAPPAPAPAGPEMQPGTPGSAGVVTTCRRRGRRLVCSNPRRRAPRRARARVRGIEVVRSDRSDTPKVTFLSAVGGMLAQAGDRLTWWD